MKETPQPTDSESHPPDGHAGGGFWAFLRTHKVWWIIPLLLAVALVAVILYMGQAGAGQFEYP